MTNNRRSWLIFGLSAILSIGGLLVLLRSFDVERLGAAFETVDYRFFLLSFVIATATQIIPPLRWQVLLDGAISLRHGAAAMWIGNFLNALLPLRMGEAASAGLIYRSERIPLTASVPTMIAGRVMDVAALLALALALLLTGSLPPELIQASIILAALTGIGLLILVITLKFVPAASALVEPYVANAFSGKPYELLKRIGQKIMQSVRILQDPSHLAYSLGLSLFFWFANAVAGGAMALSLQQDQVLVLGLMMSFAGGIGRLLPALPGSIGTLDAVTLIGLTALGVGETEALALVLLLRLRYTLMVALTGMIGFFIEGHFGLRPIVAESAE